jgi:5-oxoprolinase (ATP-hydrolysing) subunit A
VRIDLNSDIGESLGPWPMGRDAELIPLVSSVSIACGFHAGDPLVMERTVGLALAAGVSLGAHPGYPDLIGFGRRDLAMASDELEAAVLYQVAALAGIARAHGAELRHVKAHGALYNHAAVEPAVAEPVARAVRRFSPELVLLGPPGSALLEAGQAEGLPVAAEGFADRAYEPDGTLRSRRLEGALLDDPAAAAEQAVSMVRDGVVRATDGSMVRMRIASLCIHGDTPNAPAIARAVRAALEGQGIDIGLPEP